MRNHSWSDFHCLSVLPYGRATAPRPVPSVHVSSPLALIDLIAFGSLAPMKA